MKKLSRLLALIMVLASLTITMTACNVMDKTMEPYTFGGVTVNIIKDYEIDESDEGGYGIKGRDPYVRFVDPKDNTNSIMIIYEECQFNIDEEEFDLTGYDVEILSSRKFKIDGVDAWLIHSKYEDYDENGTLYFYSLNLYFNDKHTIIQTYTYNSEIDAIMGNIIDNVKVADNGDSKEIQPTAIPEPTKSPEALYAENMEKVEMCIETGNYSAAVEILEGINTPEAQKAIDGINAIDYVNQVIEKLSEDWMLSGTLAGIDVSFDYDPMTYTFYQTFVMSEIYDIAYSFADEDSSYINDDTAKNLYYDYFYGKGYEGITCVAIVRNSSNEFLEDVTYGGDDSPVPTPVPTPVPAQEPTPAPIPTPDPIHQYYEFYDFYGVSVPIPTGYRFLEGESTSNSEKFISADYTSSITVYKEDGYDNASTTLASNYVPTYDNYSNLSYDYFSNNGSIVKSAISYDCELSRYYEYDITMYFDDYKVGINMIGLELTNNIHKTIFDYIGEQR